MDLSDAHILFFLGSGVSTELPGVQEISCKVFTESMTTYKGLPYVSKKRETRAREEYPRRVPRIRRFLEIVKEKAQQIRRERYQDCEDIAYDYITYEDLYFLCEQIRDEYQEAASFRLNEAVRPFADQIMEEVETDGLLCDLPDHDFCSDYTWIADHGCRLIRGVARELLNNIDVQCGEDTGDVVGFDCLRGAIDEWHNEQLGRITVVTLNHDLVLEELMLRDERDKIGFKDGFDGEYGDEEPRSYNPASLFSDSSEIPLIKPHGSINWFYRENKPSSQNLIACNGNVEEFIKNGSWDEGSEEAEFIASTGKERDYPRDWMGDMTEAFLYHLRNADIVVESGFGWNDRGMSEHLKRHLDQDRLTSLIHLHASPCEGSHLPGVLNKSSAKGRIKAHFDRRFEDCTCHVEQWLCSTPWGSDKEGNKGLKDIISKILSDTPPKNYSRDAD